LNIPTQFKAFFSKDALELAIWAYEEKDREKQIRIARIADKIEIKSTIWWSKWNKKRTTHDRVSFYAVTKDNEVSTSTTKTTTV